MTEEDLAERPVLPKGTNPEDRSPWNPGMRTFESAPTTVPTDASVEAAMANDGGLESSPETTEDGRKRVQQVGEAACSLVFAAAETPKQKCVERRKATRRWVINLQINLKYQQESDIITLVIVKQQPMSVGHGRVEIEYLSLSG